MAIDPIQAERPLLILVIEDDADVAELMSMALEAAGAVVVTARDGERGLKLSDVVEPDAVVVDMMMPVLDGFGFLRAYRSRDGAAPAVAVSGFGPYLKAAEDEGAAASLRKPFDMEAFTTTVRRLAEGRRRERSRPHPRAAAPVEGGSRPASPGRDTSGSAGGERAIAAFGSGAAPGGGDGAEGGAEGAEGGGGDADGDADGGDGSAGVAGTSGAGTADDGGHGGNDGGDGGHAGGGARAHAAAAEEAARLHAIRALGLESPGARPDLDTFIARVAAHFGAEIALVSIVTQDRQQWAAQCGLPESIAATGGVRREHSFCTHAVAARAALVVPDAYENPLFRDNPLIREAKLRFYAGVPLIARAGEALGTLCLMGRRPRSFGHTDLELLSVFARAVMAAFEREESAHHSEIPSDAFRYLNYVADPELDILGRAAFSDLTVVEGMRGVMQGAPVSCGVVSAPAGELGALVAELRELRPKSFVGRLDTARVGWLVPSADPLSIERAAARAAGSRGRAAAIDVTAYAGGALTRALTAAERRVGARTATPLASRTS